MFRYKDMLCSFYDLRLTALVFCQKQNNNRPRCIHIFIQNHRYISRPTPTHIHSKRHTYTYIYKETHRHMSRHTHTSQIRHMSQIRHIYHRLSQWKHPIVWVNVQYWIEVVVIETDFAGTQGSPRKCIFKTLILYLLFMTMKN